VVAPASGKQAHKLSFQLVYPDRSGRLTSRPIGTVFSSPTPHQTDQDKCLHHVQFVTGDYLDVAIFEERRR
jgi:hypothetical protein